MKIDVEILAVIEGLIFLTQVIVLFVQYKVNKNYKGIKLWLLGSTTTVIGVIFMAMIEVKSLKWIEIASNPLMVLGQILLYVGILHFLNNKENREILFFIFIVFMITYFYFIIVYNDISSRTVVITMTLAIISIMTSYQLFFKKDKVISGTANFTSIVFLLNGCFLVMRTFFAIILPPMQTYSDEPIILLFALIVPMVTSTLWTFGFIIMVNQRLNMENLAGKERLQQIFNTSPDAVLITRLGDGLIIDVNGGFSQISGYTHDEAVGNYTFKMNFWGAEEREAFIIELKEKGFCENKEIDFKRKDGHRFFSMISARIVTIYDVPHIISIIHDITNRKQAEEALIESEEQYRSILNASPDDITITNMEGSIIMVSPAAKRMFGFDLNYEGFVGMHLLDFILPEDKDIAQSNMILMNAGSYEGTNEYRGVRNDGSIFDVEVNRGFISNANGEHIKMVFIIRDITERKTAEQKITELVKQLEIERNTAQENSITDSLTGLSNRRYFDDALRREFSRLKRVGTTLSLIILDVDYFKKFNDSYGHLAGDYCLQQIATTIKTIVEGVPNIVARYGGEEFVVLMPQPEEHEAEELAEKIRKAIEVLNIPHAASQITDYVTVSLGVVTVHNDELSSQDQVVKLADEALYAAKKSGRNRTIVKEVPGT